MSPPETPAAPPRLVSVDLLRGLVLLVMLFVNDLSGVKGVPPWMEHIQPSDRNGMTFVDVVFPAFLFVVGLSIPLALGRRLERAGELWRPILARVLGLLVIGVFMVNTETISKNAPLSPTLWGLLMYGAVLCLWIVAPGIPRGITLGLRVVGAVALVALAVLYRGNEATGLLQMRLQWWGILGLIGWAYLVASSVYVATRGSLTALVAAIPLLYCLRIASAAGGLDRVPVVGWLSQWVDVGSMLGSLAAVSVSGVALGLLLARPAAPAARIRTAFFYGLALWVAGWLLHTAHGFHSVFFYNKNAATPPWCLVSSALTAWLWIPAYLVGDVRPARLWTATLAVSGQNALLAYILAPILYYVLERVALAPPYYALGGQFATGFCRALAFAALVSWLAGLLKRRGVALKL